MTSPYVVQTWTDGAGGGTPVNAARLGHIEAGLSGHETRLTALEADSGWVAVTVATPTYTANGAPVVRKIGKRVQGNAGITNTGLAINAAYLAVMTIPAGYRPDKTNYQPAGTSGGAIPGMFTINTDGTVDLRTGGTLGTFYRLDPCSWWVA